MSLALLIGLQAAAASAPAPEAVDFDLARYRPSAGRGCGGAAPGEILVCGRRLNQDTDPTGALARRYAPRGLPMVEVGLGGSVVGRAFTEAYDMGRGAVSKRIMIGVKTPF